MQRGGGPLDYDNDMDEEYLSTVADVLFAEFIATDDNVPTCEPQSFAKIVAEVVADEATEHSGDIGSLNQSTTFAEALVGLEDFQRFFRTINNENADKCQQSMQKELFLSKGETHQQNATVF